jgi:hypothetical protein
MNQSIQELKTQVRKASSTLGKAHVIAVSRRIRKSSQGNMWMVESSSTNGKFYKWNTLKKLRDFSVNVRRLNMEMAVNASISFP